MKARCNPFRSERVLRTIRFQPVDRDWSALMQRLAETRYRAAIIGPKGSGKTTLLEDLQPRLRARGFSTAMVRLTLERRRVSTAERAALARLQSGTVVLVDGADLLAPWRWWLLRNSTRAAAGLIVTSHRRALLPPLLHTTTSPALLNRIVQQLIQESDSSTLNEHEIGGLYRRHDGNIRDALRELYDRAAG